MLCPRNGDDFKQLRLVTDVIRLEKVQLVADNLIVDYLRKILNKLLIIAELAIDIFN